MRIPEEKEIFTDLRVIDLHRQARKDIPISGLGDQDWLTLGHFDWLHIDALSRDTTSCGVNLSLIQAHNQELTRYSVDTYGHPIYIFQEVPVSHKRWFDAFWALPAPFLMLTRVHASVFEQQVFESLVYQCLRDTDAGDGLSPKSCPDPVPNGFSSDGDVRFLLYRTMEFSDLILVAKAESIQSLLKTVGRLYFLPCVGDIYSYCGISPAALMQPPAQTASIQDRIPFAMMRFAVRDARNAREFLNTLRSDLPETIRSKLIPPLFVTGMEDMMLVSRELCSADLCAIVRSVLPSSENLRLSKRKGISSFWDAFDDMTTRLSLEEGCLVPRDKTQTPKDDISIYGIYDSLYQRFLEISYSAAKEYPDWVRPTAELLKALRTISRDYILRQVCYTVLDGARATVLLSKKVMSAELDEQAALRNLTMLLMTLSNISDLMEHMIRMEGELVHHPETRPLLYDIPANLLELYLSFSDLCLTYYQEREKAGRETRRFMLLIVPCLCRTIAVINTGDDREEKDAFLYVEVPLHLLYDPGYAICSLVHEVAHFSGEKTRAREYRVSMLAFCVAVQASIPLYLSDSMQAIQFLYKRIKASIPKEAETYSSDLERSLKSIVADIYSDASFRDELKLRYFEDIMTQKDADARYEKAVRAKVGNQELSFAHQNVRELVYLFREGYADLAMVSLLELSANEYLHMVEKELDPENDEMLPCAVERVSLVIYAAFPSNDFRDLSGDGKFCQLVRSYLQWLFAGQDRKPFHQAYHNFEAVGAVAYYLRECIRRMKECDLQSENADCLIDIRKQFALFAKEGRFASTGFFKVLEQYRNKLLRAEST